MVARDPGAPTAYALYDPHAADDAWIEQVLVRLRTEYGIDADFAKWTIAPGDPIAKAIEDAVRGNDFLLLICTPEFAYAFDEREGQSGYAAGLITASLMEANQRKRLLVILRRGLRETSIPAALRGIGFFDLRGEPYADHEFNRLVQTVRRVRVRPPAVGSAASDIEGPADDAVPIRSWEHLAWDDLVRRCLSSVRYRSASLREQLRIIPEDLELAAHVESSLAGAWADFIGGATWKQECLRDADTLVAMLEQFRDLPEAEAFDTALTELKRAMDRPDPYRVIRALFDRRRAESLFRAIHVLRSAALGRDGRDAVRHGRTRDALDAVQRKAADLVNLGQKDTYRSCFLLMSGAGAGKSHFLLSVLSSFEEDHQAEMPWNARWLPIWVERPARTTSLEGQLLAAIRRTTMVEWPDVATFLAFARSRRIAAKVVIVIDDLHKWIDADPAVRDELAHLIEDFTRHDTACWLITINDRAYGDLASLTERVWGAYCDAGRNYFRGAPQGRIRERLLLPRSGGWYRLDDIVEDDETGLEILRNAVRAPDGDGDSAPDRIASGLAFDRIRTLREADRRHLSNPLVASVVVAVSRKQRVDIGTLVDMRFADFIEHLRTLLIERSVAEMPASSDRRLLIEQAVDYVARAFSDSHGPQHPSWKIREHVMELAAGDSALAQPAAVATAFEALERAHLVECSELDAPSGITRIEWMTLRLEPFWEYHLARQQMSKVRHERLPADAAVAALAEWTRAFAGSRLQTGVAQFLLILADAQSMPFADELWYQAVEGGVLPAAGVLFAAGRARPARQSYVGTNLLRRRIVPKSADDLLALVSFTHVADVEAVFIEDRVRMLQPHYGSLEREGLGDYAAFAVAQTIQRVETLPQMREVITALEGSEMLGPANELAQLSVKTLRRILREDNFEGLIDETAKIVSRRGKLSRDYEMQRQEQVRSQQAKGADRFLFRHWLLDQVCHDLAWEKRTDTYDYLWNRRWYQAADHGIPPWIAIEMEKFANFAISDVLRNSSDGRKELVALVRDLVDTNHASHRSNAFYLIRHSEPIAIPGLDIAVDAVFHPDLRTLAVDPRLRRLRERFGAFFAANLPDLRPLDDVQGPARETGRIKRSRGRGPRPKDRRR